MLITPALRFRTYLLTEPRLFLLQFCTEHLQCVVTSLWCHFWLSNLVFSLVLSKIYWHRPAAISDSFTMIAVNPLWVH